MLPTFIKICLNIWFRILSSENSFFIEPHKRRKNTNAPGTTEADYPTFCILIV